MKERELATDKPNESQIKRDRKIEGIVYVKRKEGRQGEEKWVIALGTRQVSKRSFKKRWQAALYLRMRWKTVSIVIMAAVATLTTDWARSMQELGNETGKEK